MPCYFVGPTKDGAGPTLSCARPQKVDLPPVPTPPNRLCDRPRTLSGHPSGERSPCRIMENARRQELLGNSCPVQSSPSVGTANGGAKKWEASEESSPLRMKALE